MMKKYFWLFVVQILFSVIMIQLTGELLKYQYSYYPIVLGKQAFGYPFPFCVAAHALRNTKDDPDPQEQSYVYDEDNYDKEVQEWLDRIRKVVPFSARFFCNCYDESVTSGIFIWEDHHWSDEGKILCPLYLLEFQLTENLELPFRVNFQLTITDPHLWHEYSSRYGYWIASRNSPERAPLSGYNYLFSVALAMNLVFIALVIRCLFYLRQSDVLTRHPRRWNFLFLFAQIYLGWWILQHIYIYFVFDDTNQWFFQLLHATCNIAMLMLFFCLYEWAGTGVYRLWRIGNKVYLSMRHSAPTS